ncbi:cupin-like domain-containing protein [Pseudomonas sp. nanlin1]|uniref:cupin-like domain-containing protein n=1 Tax=Pseudomonas sp. nanlin1 TaxID=3040605 RepID=UPI0038904B79
MCLINKVSELFYNADLVGVSGVFQFVFSDSDRYWINAPKSKTAQCGMHAFPDVTIHILEYFFYKVVQGEADIEQLFSEGRLKIVGDLGRATLIPDLIRAIDRKNSGAIEVVMNKRYPALPRFSEDVSERLSFDNGVMRIPADDLSRKEFTVNHRLKGIPVVISQGLRDWPLFSMSRDSVQEIFSNLQGITRHGAYVDKAFSTEREFRVSSISEFIANIDDMPRKSSDELPAYMGNNILPERLIEFIKFPNFFDRSLYHTPRFWLGPEGTLTPLHRDDVDNIFAQVWGEKSVLLAAPHNREALGCWSTSLNGGLEGCDFKPTAPDYTAFPKAEQVLFIEVNLKPGDILFLPEGWFHEIKSLTSSLSINFWVKSMRTLSEQLKSERVKVDIL